MENGAIIGLLSGIGILLFLVGYLLGERRREPKMLPGNTEFLDLPPKQAEIPTEYRIPKAPPSEYRPGHKPGGIRILSPREAIFKEMQKRDGLTDQPEPVPPAVAHEFLKEAAGNNTQNHKEN